MCHELSVDDVRRAMGDDIGKFACELIENLGNCRHIYTFSSFILSVNVAAATVSSDCSLPAHRLHIYDIWMVHCKTRKTREENIIQFVKIYRQCIRLLRIHRGTLSFSAIVDRYVSLSSLSMYICIYIYVLFVWRCRRWSIYLNIYNDFFIL